MTGLEALNKIDEVLCDIEIKHKENLGYTKPLTKTIEKSLKALEIIKEKNVDVNEIRPNAKAKDYNSKMPYYRQNLTEEEFKLLKEVLK